MHMTNVSDETLEVIFTNECGDVSDLTTKRFRRLQNEIEALKKKIEEAAKIADREGDRIMKIAYKADNAGEFDLYEALESQATVASGIADKIRHLMRPTNG